MTTQSAEAPVAEETKISATLLKHLFVEAEKDAALALEASTEALIKWANAMAAFRAGTGTASDAVTFEEYFDEKLGKRLLADGKVDYLKKLYAQAVAKS